ncbi:galactokinase [bacterium]|nr:galactokinase [bacterium]
MLEISKLLAGLKSGAPEIKAALDGVYNTDAAPRVIRLIEHFTARFPKHKEVSVLRAPGRVNLIGEHTDYNGLPVLPMAIDNDMLVALAPRHDRRINAVNPDFPDRSFEIEDQIPHYDTGDWGNYIKAGVQGIVDELGGVDGLQGFDACFYGTVPVGGGLSSSSTVVVAAAMAVLRSTGMQLEPQRLAERMARAEWYVGTQGGGMDHAVCILNEKGKALKIDFFPLRVTPVSIPQGFAIVVANSMVKASKTAETRMQYNMRPAMCRVAAAMLSRRLGLEKMELLGDIYFGIGRERMLAALDETFTRPSYTRAELAACLGLELDELNRLFLTTKGGELLPDPPEGFRIGQRARHVVTETVRVEESSAAVEQGDGLRFGELMTQSHVSCRDDYEISHPALDDLVAIGLESGSAGSRLTGAGFGGCTVHLVPEARLETVLEAFRTRYYGQALNNYPEALKRFRERPDSALLTLRPAGGARVLF